jgi:hypothetical protein
MTLREHVQAGGLWIAAISLNCAGCATQLPSLVAEPEVNSPLVLGRVLVVVTGETSRAYEPEMRSLEFESQQTHERFNVEVKSEDRHFVIALPSGEYRLNRVQISEGPFMSMAEVSAAFTVHTDGVTYVGTWRFGVDSPRYGRMLAFSMVMDSDDRSVAHAFLVKQYPGWKDASVTSVPPSPSAMEARLYEVMPYPRYPTYFRRHNW